jgi:hypothetical protein
MRAAVSMRVCAQSPQTYDGLPSFRYPQWVVSPSQKRRLQETQASWCSCASRRSSGVSREVVVLTDTSWRPNAGVHRRTKRAARVRPSGTRCWASCNGYLNVPYVAPAQGAEPHLILTSDRSVLDVRTARRFMNLRWSSTYCLVIGNGSAPW